MTCIFKMLREVVKMIFYALFSKQIKGLLLTPPAHLPTKTLTNIIRH